MDNGSTFFVCLFFLLGCQSENRFPLDRFFTDLETHSPQAVLIQFKNIPLDSAVLNHKEYSEIFVEAASVVLRDSSQMLLFENYCEDNEISLTYEADLYTIVAAFHKWLNNEAINIKHLRLEMIKMADEINEKENKTKR
jgi:hypothetical protein